MLQRIRLVGIFWLYLLSVMYAQDGKLTGKVSNQNGEPLPFATVIVFEGDLVRYGTQTDNTGVYSIQPISVGTYKVEFRYLGAKQIRSDVPIIDGQTRQLDVRFTDGVTQTDTVQIESYVNPVFEKDPKVASVLSGKDVQSIGTRNVQSLAAITPGVYQSDEGDGGINIRGARSNATVYYVDGVKIRGVTTLPQQSIEQLQVITGGTPAEYGDFTGGVISITTARPSPKFGGGLELVSSEFLDPYGRNLAALTLTGPLIKKTETVEGFDYKRSVLGFFLSGEFDYQEDSDPGARGVVRLNDGILEDLQQTPLQFNTDGENFISRANFIRAEDIADMDAKAQNEDQRIRVLGRLDFQPTDNIVMKLGGSYENITSDLWSTANQLFAPEGNTQFSGNSYRGWFRFQQNFKSGEGSLLKNLFYSLQADYSLYQRRFQDRVHKDNFFDYGYIGQFDFDIVPLYQYVDDPQSEISSSPYWQVIEYGENNLRFDATNSKNPLLSRYNEVIFDYVAENGVNNLFPGLFSNEPVVNSLTNLNELAFRGGLRNGDFPRSVYSLFSGVGSSPGSYTKFDFEQFRLSGQATAEIKGHNLKAGFEFEQRLERFYAIQLRGGGGVWDLMRQYTNFHLNNLEGDPGLFEYVIRNGEFQDTVVVPLQYSGSDQKVFDRNLRARLGLPVDGTERINIDGLPLETFSLDLFNADELLNNGLGAVTYYGYDHLGNKTQTVDDSEFFSDLDNRPLNPFSPTYISAFIQDKFEFEDIIFNVGLRVDRFDANQPVLKDNFSLYPTYTAGEAASGSLAFPSFDLPGGVGADWIPYVDDAANPSEIIGYRNGESWFDANGAPVSSNVIAASSGGKPKPYVQEEEVSINSFKDYEPQTVFMPRISFSFPISDVALFFAHYDVLAQRPGQLLPTQGSLLAGQISDYAFLENRPTVEVNNPNLKPEITVDYEAGFKQKIGQRMALNVSAFYREFRDQIRFRRFANAFPFSYDTYDNLDFSTVKGFVFSFDMRRTKNTQLRLGYTLSFADGTGSSFSSARNVVNFLEGVGVLRVPLPLDIDQRHRFS
ncbi:MAG: TonB-dependent receptor, partial [Bacteroidota bacterium]